MFYQELTINQSILCLEMLVFDPFLIPLKVLCSDEFNLQSLEVVNSSVLVNMWSTYVRNLDLLLVVSILSFTFPITCLQ